MRRVVFALALAGCASERVDQLEARLAELKAENERLSRDVADLRKTGAPAAQGTATPAGATDRTRELEASLRALLDRMSRTLPAPSGRVDGEVVGVWRAPTPESTPKDARGPVEIVVHYGDGGRLCGYRVLGGAAHEKQPFWGRWERHGRLVLELHDRWVGDHNEHDGFVRSLETLDGDAMLLDGAEALHFAKVPDGGWKKLASLYDDREVPIPGLPGWCFQK